MDWETVSVTAIRPGIEIIIKPNDDEEHEDDESLGNRLSVGRPESTAGICRE